MGHGKQLIVVVEGGRKVDKEETRFTLKYLVEITRRVFFCKELLRGVIIGSVLCI